MNYVGAVIPLHFCNRGRRWEVDKMKQLLLVLFSLFSSSNLFAANVKATVTFIVDGNTIELLTSDKRKLKVLLYGIDSPELGQKFGIEAKKYLQDKLLNKQVSVDFKGKDSNGHLLAVVTIESGIDIRVELLKEGLAWTAEKDAIMDLEPYRIWAQRKGRGLWQEQNPLPPWTYRRQQAMQKPKIR